MTSGSDQSAGQPPRERLTVSLSSDLVRGLKSAAAESDARSVSAYVEYLLRKEEWLRRWKLAVGEPDPDALAQARQALLADQPQPPAS
ncbi:MAG: hypothetical protein H0V92_00990 [Pseudonocardiales bacterium]|nr:hypothetical protein [Pseudonocardiales bacterium]